MSNAQPSRPTDTMVGGLSVTAPSYPSQRSALPPAAHPPVRGGVVPEVAVSRGDFPAEVVPRVQLVQASQHRSTPSSSSGSTLTGPFRSAVLAAVDRRRSLGGYSHRSSLGSVGCHLSTCSSGEQQFCPSLSSQGVGVTTPPPVQPHKDPAAPSPWALLSSTALAPRPIAHESTPSEALGEVTSFTAESLRGGDGPGPDWSVDDQLASVLFSVLREEGEGEARADPTLAPTFREQMGGQLPPSPFLGQLRSDGPRPPAPENIAQPPQNIPAVSVLMRLASELRETSTSVSIPSARGLTVPAVHQRGFADSGTGFQIPGTHPFLSQHVGFPQRINPPQVQVNPLAGGVAARLGSKAGYPPAEQDPQRTISVILVPAVQSHTLKGPELPGMPLPSASYAQSLRMELSSRSQAPPDAFFPIVTTPRGHPSLETQSEGGPGAPASLP
eukprot:RCo048001